MEYNNNIFIICNNIEELNNVLNNPSIKKQIKNKDKEKPEQQIKKDTRLSRLQILNLIDKNKDRLQKKDVQYILRGYAD